MEPFRRLRSPRRMNGDVIDCELLLTTNIQEPLLENAEERSIDGLEANDDESSSGSSSSSSSSLEVRSNCYWRWRAASNGFFFIGGVLFAILAVKDVIDAYRSDDDDSNDSTDGGGTAALYYWDAYKTLNVIAALFYVLNAAVDYGASSQVLDDHPDSDRYGDDPRLELAEPVTFGLAALIELWAVFLQDAHPRREAAALVVSSHFYVVNAILSLWGRCCSLSCHSTSAGLESVGDVLFMFGSAVDLIASYKYYMNQPDMTQEKEQELSWWNLASAVLWTVDALCYIVSDFSRKRRSERLNDECKHR